MSKAKDQQTRTPKGARAESQRRENQWQENAATIHEEAEAIQRAAARERGKCSRQPSCRCPGCREFRRRQSEESRQQAWRVFQIQVGDASRNLIDRLRQADEWEDK